MITKAFIQDVINPHTVRVRIPMYNKLDGTQGSTPKSELPLAPICTVANIINDPHPGDVVFVSFEDDDLSKPIVLGYLSLANMGLSYTDIVCDDLEAKGEIRLSEDMVVGEIKYENIFQLKNLNENVVEKFQEIDRLIDEINVEIKKLQDQDATFDKVIGNKETEEGKENPDDETLWGSILINKRDITNINLTIGAKGQPSPSSFSEDDNTLRGNLNYLNNNSISNKTPVLKGSYGDKLPTKGEEGQLYFIPLSKVSESQLLDE